MKYKLVPIDTVPLFDTHSHSVDHGKVMAAYNVQSVKDWIDFCAKNGLQTVCLTDHIPLPKKKIDPTPEKDCGLPQKNFSDVLINNKILLRDYAKRKNIHLLIGGEFDFFAEDKQFYDDLEKKYQPEWKVLGQHVIDTIVVNPDKNGVDCYGESITEAKEKLFCFDFSEEVFAYGVKQKGAETLVKRYFELLEEALTLQTYDSVAHIDLITKYNANNKYFVEDENYKKQLMTILQVMKKKNMILEINLGGIQAANRFVPNEWIIKETLRLDVPLTIGSDAHGSEDTIQLFNNVKNLLKEVGVTQLAIPYQQ